MTGKGKTLTVSYGSFSCTLEGFDDPFSTMRALAEYFRDLTTENQNFGVDAVTPNADAMHQIAQNVSHTALDAEVTANSLILRKSVHADTVYERSPQTQNAPVERNMAENLAQLRSAVTEDHNNDHILEDTLAPLSETDPPESDLWQDFEEDNAHGDVASFSTGRTKSKKLESVVQHAQEDSARSMRIARRTEAHVEDNETALERLMGVTSSRIDHDESSDRRASIAHLKAAVAATKADASITQIADEQEEREIDQYRDDLTRVVKSTPREPEQPKEMFGENAAHRNENNAVAEDPTAYPMQQDRGFAHFASQSGARTLSEFLEVAAAYLTYIQGDPEFTRPMLMQEIAKITEKSPISREAGLRSFGTLLREGKLLKHDGGKFVLSPNSNFAQLKSDTA